MDCVQSGSGRLARLGDPYVSAVALIAARADGRPDVYRYLAGHVSPAVVDALVSVVVAEMHANGTDPRVMLRGLLTAEGVA